MSKERAASSLKLENKNKSYSHGSSLSHFMLAVTDEPEADRELLKAAQVTSFLIIYLLLFFNTTKIQGGK